ncbi:MAG: DUF3500 domain-containing protein, partial [Verrucomicrobiales bacterium]
WHYIPRERRGLPLKEMAPGPRLLAHALLDTGLSNRGYRKALTIMTLEQILWELENHAPKRDPEMYFFSIFGEPGSEGAWGWRVEGHHFSVNFTIVDGRHVSGTPTFFATNPGRVSEGPRKGLQVLAREENIARKLVTSLDEKQRGKAVISDQAPRDILTAAEPKVAPLEAKGLKHSEMNEQQQAALMGLIREYVHNHRPEMARAELAAIEKAGLEDILFAWAGSIERGQGHYYRVQGSDFLLEYANTQNDANHVHASWRSYEGDFGESYLARHYREAHKK